MKYCHRCGTGNQEGQLFCQGCGKPLQKNAREQSIKMAQAETAFQEKKEIRRQRTGYWLLAGMYVLYIALMILLAGAGKIHEPGLFPLLCIVVLICPALGYLLLYKTEWMFKIEHFFCIKNLDQAEPSDWYEFDAKISGVLIWALGIGLLIAPWIFY